MDDERMYRGFDLDAAEAAQAEDWLRSHFGPGVQDRIDRSRAIGAGWSDEDREAYFREGRAFDAGVAKAIKEGLPASSETVQGLVRAHCATVCRGWGIAPAKGPCLALAEIYREGPMFRPRFAGIAPGAAEYIGDAIKAYAEGELGSDR